MKVYKLVDSNSHVVFGKNHVIASDAKGTHVNKDGIGYLIEGDFVEVVADLEGETIELPKVPDPEPAEKAES